MIEDKKTDHAETAKRRGRPRKPVQVMDPAADENHLATLTCRYKSGLKLYDFDFKYRQKDDELEIYFIEARHNKKPISIETVVNRFGKTRLLNIIKDTMVKKRIILRSSHLWFSVPGL